MGLCLAAGFPQSANAQTKSNPESSKMWLFLLAGQSNMAGRGEVELVDLQPHPRVFTFTRDLQWKPAIDPIHFDKPGVVGVGPGKTFGTIIAEHYPDVIVGLIPCAVGGSPIDSWQEGAYYPPTKSHPWDNAIHRAKQAMQYGEMKGIIWHQGESDSNEQLAAGYECKLHDLIARFRNELGNAEIPFIAGQMGIFEERPWNSAKQKVDEAHRQLPDKVENTVFVSAEGLSHKGDEIHFNSASYREFGKRYAEAIIKLEKK